MKESEKIPAKWIAKANEDFAFVTKFCEENLNILYFQSVVLFHCEQAIEKYLKGFLVFKNVLFPKTNHLEFINQLCIEHGGRDFEVLDFGNLSSYAGDYFSSEKSEEVTIEEMKSYFQLASEIKSLVESKIKFQTP